MRCASRTGYGDGSYVCYIKRDADGQLIAAFIEYIGNEIEENEEEEEYAD